MRSEDRHAQIVELAKVRGRVLVDELAAHFDVSAQTIRKDLNDLCDQRPPARVHGGAVFPSGIENMQYEARRQIAAEEKEAIGRAAARADPEQCLAVHQYRHDDRGRQPGAAGSRRPDGDHQ